MKWMLSLDLPSQLFWLQFGVIWQASNRSNNNQHAWPVAWSTILGRYKNFATEFPFRFLKWDTTVTKPMFFLLQKYKSPFVMTCFL